MMIDVLAGVALAAAIVAFMVIYTCLGVFLGNLYVKLVDGPYVDPSKVRTCGDIRDDF